MDAAAAYGEGLHRLAQAGSSQLRGPAGAFRLVGIELVVGTILLMWVTLLFWRVVDRGHYRSVTWVLIPLCAGLAFALKGTLRAEILVIGAFLACFLASIYAQRPLLEWASGALAAAAGGWVLAASGSGSCGGCVAGAGLAASGAVFLGAVTHGMALGHWYLNQPRLPIEPLKGATHIMMGSFAVALLAGVLGRGRLLSGRVSGGILAVSSSGYWWAWLLLLAGTAFLGLMVRSTVWSRSTQSATGLLYVAMLTALGSQFLMAILQAS